ncbi:MAG: tetratricopeptide repeat protein [Candidatus Krumholzibacteriota bacterium]|nr:tetratricopeptide repeat protein [Candidatus Krumholzibacteriota bacterium]
MFVTQDKILKKVSSDRQRGDLKRALRRALNGLEKWPEDFDLAMETIQLCFDTSEFKQAVTLLKSALRQHPKKSPQILSFARETQKQLLNPLLGSFVIENLMRSRDIEGVRDLFRNSSPHYINSLIKRSEIRSKGFSDSGQCGGSQYAENELLLGLLYMVNNQFEEAVAPLGRAFISSPQDAQTMGSLFLELEREQPHNAAVKYYLGLASCSLSHPEKAEPRFFQCLEFDNPPLEDLLRLLDSLKEKSAHHRLLKGEVLIRLEREEEGIEEIKKYLEEHGDKWENESAEESLKQLFPDQINHREFVLDRLARLLGGEARKPSVTFLFCRIAAGMGKIKESVQQLEILFHSGPENGPGIIGWIEENDDIAQTAPAQKLLARLNLAEGNLEPAARAMRLASEMDPVQIPSLSGMIKEELEKSPSPERETALYSMQVELHAKSGNSEGAQRILRELSDDNAIEEDELFRLTSEILEYCGITLEGVISALELSIKNDQITDALPFALKFYQNNPDSHIEFAERIKTLARNETGEKEVWPFLAELLDLMAEEEQLTRPFNFLRALSHLHTGKVERAVFEFDQLMMLDQSIGLDLIPIYEEATERYPDNTTLHLALYQINLEEEQYAQASHYLSRALKSDPEQIRDLMPKFEKLVEKEPHNREIWEEMLKSALAMNHLNLARELLRRAVMTLPQEAAATLHIYGARISSADGKPEDSLRCLAMTLTSREASLKQVEDELKFITEKNPSNPEARYLMGETLMRLGREDESVAALEKCLELSPAYLDKVRSRLEQLLPLSIKPWLISRILGEIAWAGTRFEEAYRLLESAQNGPAESLAGLGTTLEKLLILSPQDNRLALIRTRNLSLEGRGDEAVELSRTLLAHDPSRREEIVRIIRELLERVPEHFEANRFLAGVYAVSGDGGRSLEPVLRMIEATDTAPERIDEAVAEFLEIHRENSRFLVPYAGLRARCQDPSDALDRCAQALGFDPSSWDKILAQMDEVEWTDPLDTPAALLRADCFLQGNQPGKAYRQLESISIRDDETRSQIVSRLYRLIEHEPAREYFHLGSLLLAELDQIDEAEELVKRGCAALDDSAAIDLRITLAEILENGGLEKRASALFREILDDAEDGNEILKRIEKAITGWAVKEIRTGMEKIGAEPADAESIEKLVGTAQLLGKHDQGLEIVGRSQIPSDHRRALLARIYLWMDKPTLSLALSGAVENPGQLPPATRLEYYYSAGKASEMLGDHGRAALSFSRTLEISDQFRDSRQRAESNYAKFIESQFENNIDLLVKTGNLDPD